MSQNQIDNPLSNSSSNASDSMSKSVFQPSTDPLSNMDSSVPGNLSRSTFQSKKTNPYASQSTAQNISPQVTQEVPKIDPTPVRQEQSSPTLPEERKERLFTAPNFKNPFLNKANSPTNPNSIPSSMETSSTSQSLSQSTIVTPPRVDYTPPPRNPVKKQQPILFVPGMGLPSTPQPLPLKKEPLKGIYAFFGSEELPINPRASNYINLPHGLEAIPYIFQNHCYAQGLEVINALMQRAANAEEKMYFRTIKFICLLKLQMWEKINLEFSGLGNIDKIIFEPSSQTNLPYHLRLIYAMTPILSAQTHLKNQKFATPEVQEQQTLERLFSLFSFCTGMVKQQPYPEINSNQNENITIHSLCDTDVSQESKTALVPLNQRIEWVSRVFKVGLIIIELLLYKASTKTATEFIDDMLKKFGDNGVVLAYQARLKMIVIISQGEYKDAKALFAQINDKLPQDEYLAFLNFNAFIQISHDLKYDEARPLLIELGQKYPQYSTLVTNNLAYIQFAQCEIRESIKTLEDFIRNEPWNINEVMVYNLFNAYDFFYGDSTEKKKVIHEIVDKYGNGFNKVSTFNESKA